MKKTILIVDDSPTDIELTTIALDAIGCKMTLSSAPDGKSALEKLRHGLRVPALILLDLKMPGMTGIEVLSEIRADDRLMQIPVVVLTSSALESDRVAALAAGANAYFQKPLALNQFSKDLESILHRWLPNIDTLLKVPVSISGSIRELTGNFKNPHFCDILRMCTSQLA